MWDCENGSRFAVRRHRSKRVEVIVMAQRIAYWAQRQDQGAEVRPARASPEFYA